MQTRSRKVVPSSFNMILKWCGNWYRIRCILLIRWSLAWSDVSWCPRLLLNLCAFVLQAGSSLNSHENDKALFRLWCHLHASLRKNHGIRCPQWLSNDGLWEIPAAHSMESEFKARRYYLWAKQSLSLTLHQFKIKKRQLACCAKHSGVRFSWFLPQLVPWLFQPTSRCLFRSPAFWDRDPQRNPNPKKS